MLVSENCDATTTLSEQTLLCMLSRMFSRILLDAPQLNCIFVEAFVSIPVERGGGGE